MNTEDDLTPDPDIERAFKWLLSFLPAGEWERRKSSIEAYLEALFQPKPSMAAATQFQRLVGTEDRIGWYLYLVETSLYEPYRTELHQASRVLPVFQRLGTDLDRLLMIGGIESQAEKLLDPAWAQPDSVLFEMLVALLWAKNGWQEVSFIPIDQSHKRPDIRTATGSDEWFIETKRMATNSDYARKEREKWQRMWLQLSKCLCQNRYAVILDITFHVELESLDDDFLLNQLEHKLKLASAPCRLISNETWDVEVGFVDFDRIARHLVEQLVKAESRQLVELIGGSWVRNKPDRHGFWGWGGGVMT